MRRGGGVGASNVWIHTPCRVQRQADAAAQPTWRRLGSWAAVAIVHVTALSETVMESIGDGKDIEAREANGRRPDY